jgi:MFS superfamily sulfate permease-like transporter
VILSFMAGAGLLIGVGQIGNFLGAAKKGTGDQSVLYRTWLTVREGWPYNWRAIALGVATILVVVGLRADSEGWRSAFRSDGDHDSEVMSISIPS